MTERVPEHLLNQVDSVPRGYQGFLRGLPPNARVITSLGMVVVGAVLFLIVSWPIRSGYEDLFAHGQKETATLIGDPRSTPYQYEYTHQGIKHTNDIKSTEVSPSELVVGKPVSILVAPSHPEISIVEASLPGYKQSFHQMSWMYFLVLSLSPVSAILTSIGMTDDKEGWQYDDAQKAANKKWRLLALAFAGLALWPASQAVMLFIQSNAGS